MKKVRISISMVDRNTMCKESEMNTSAKNEAAFINRWSKKLGVSKAAFEQAYYVDGSMKKVRISISMVDRNTMCKESEMNTSAKNEAAFINRWSKKLGVSKAAFEQAYYVDGFETDGITSEERKMLNDLLKRKNCGAVTFCDTRHINWQSFIKLYSREL